MKHIDEKPPLIKTSDHNSFAEFTIKTRKPMILERVIDDNHFSDDVTKEIHNFLEEIRFGTIQALKNLSNNAIFWNEKVAEFEGKTWLELPWFFAETYFYRRLCEITGYYESGSINYLLDPFKVQKINLMESDLLGMIESGLFKLHERNKLPMQTYLDTCLWGNRADLSNITVNLAHSDEELTGASHLTKLIDHSINIQEVLAGGVEKISYFVDNVGREFFSDLLFIDYLLRSKLVENIHLFVKPSPFFVSDVMGKDVVDSINQLKQVGKEDIRQFAGRINGYIAHRQIIIRDPEELSTFLMFEEMNSEFYDEISDSDMVIMKGDANYRRLMGDRKWKPSRRTEEILKYFPVPLVLIRTLKAEIMTGLSEEECLDIVERDKDWMINGNYGLIQLIHKN